MVYDFYERRGDDKHERGRGLSFSCRLKPFRPPGSRGKYVITVITNARDVCFSPLTTIRLLFAAYADNVVVLLDAHIPTIPGIVPTPYIIPAKWNGKVNRRCRPGRHARAK